MVDFTYKNGSENQYLEERFLAYSDLGFPNPNTNPISLVSWGRNDYGQLGQNDILASRSTPVQIGSLTDWQSANITASSSRTFAIKSDGTLWAWGRNDFYGELGLGDRTTRSSPTQVGTLTNWKTIATGYSHTLAVKTDGTLWTWGTDFSGELGQGNRTHRSSPVQIGALTNWKEVSGGFFFSAAIKTDGTLWTWGHNGYGQLGRGDFIYRSSPVQLGALTNWKQVSCGGKSNRAGHTAAIKTDGTLWTWGHNGYGQLGLSNTALRSSPTQVGALTNWKEVSFGATHAAAIKTDGTLWTWGNNGGYQLGTGEFSGGPHRSSPVQIGALTNWKLISSGGYHGMAIKTDGTLWSWGVGVYGQLGIPYPTGGLYPGYVSSPIQVGTLTNWIDISRGFDASHTVAIKYFY